MPVDCLWCDEPGRLVEGTNLCHACFMLYALYETLANLYN